MRAVAAKPGVPRPRRCAGRRAEADAGTRPRNTTEESVELKRLKRENAELRRANEILKAAGGSLASSMPTCEPTGGARSFLRSPGLCWWLFHSYPECTPLPAGTAVPVALDAGHGGGQDNSGGSPPRCGRRGRWSARCSVPVEVRDGHPVQMRAARHDRAAHRLLPEAWADPPLSRDFLGHTDVDEPSLASHTARA